jgi:carbon monoxide dehydrogenase subunit G
MADLTETADLAASPEAVWAITRDVGGLAAWVPGVKACRLEGDLRYVTLSDGRGKAIERIVANSDENRTVEYEFVSGDMPLAEYHSRLKVEANGAGTLVTWGATLEATAEVPESEVVAGIRASYRAALECLERLVTQQT